VRGAARIRARVDVSIDGDVITVSEKRRGALALEHHERPTDGSDDSSHLTHVLRTARALRAGRRCEVRFRLETPSVVIRRLGSDRQGSARLLAVRSQLREPPLRTVLAGGAGDLTIEVDRTALEPVVLAMRALRVSGSPRVELGPLARARALVRLAGASIQGRPGIVVDLSRAALGILDLDGASLVAARFFPRDDIPSAIGQLLPAALDRLPVASRPWVRHPSAAEPWLHLASTAGEDAVLRESCRQALPRGTSIGLLCLRGAIPDQRSEAA